MPYGLTEKQVSEIHHIAERYGVTNIRLFGSRVRGDAQEDSDWDFLIDVLDDDTFSLMDIVSIQLDLEDLLQARVDVVEGKSVKHPILKSHIFSDATVL